MRARQHAVRGRDGIVVAAATLPPGVVLLDLDLGHDQDGTVIDGTDLIETFCTTGWRVLVLSGTSDEARETVFENDGDPITLMDQIADESQEPRWSPDLTVLRPAPSSARSAGVVTK